MAGRLPPLSDEEEARIQAGIALDPENPELTDEQLANLRPFSEVLPDLAAAIKRARGRPKLMAPKQPVTLRISPETIARFKDANGPNWRQRMSEVLDGAKLSGVSEGEPPATHSPR